MVTLTIESIVAFIVHWHFVYFLYVKFVTEILRLNGSGPLLDNLRVAIALRIHEMFSLQEFMCPQIYQISISQTVLMFYGDDIITLFAPVTFFVCVNVQPH